MREGVVAALIFFLAGVGFILTSMHIIPDVWHLRHIGLFVGFILLLLAPVILVSTFLLSVLPRARKKMDQCEH